MWRIIRNRENTGNHSVNPVMSRKNFTSRSISGSRHHITQQKETINALWQEGWFCECWMPQVFEGQTYVKNFRLNMPSHLQKNLPQYKPAFFVCFIYSLFTNLHLKFLLFCLMHHFFVILSQLITVEARLIGIIWQIMAHHAFGDPKSKWNVLWNHFTTSRLGLQKIFCNNDRHL